MNHIVGIIFEANPFHKGHQYLIEQVKKDLNPSCIIAITSGYFTMRGEISILSKKEKVQILLDQGIDLVIELPVHQTLNSAHVFGSSSVKYLATCGITDLCFGSECSDLKLFQDVLQLEKTEEFQNKLKQNLKLQHSYKMSYLDTVSEFLPEAKEPLSHANATLALEYLRTLELYPSITPHIYKRKGSSEEDSNLSTFPSGTALRENYLKGIDISSYLPYDSSKLSDLSTYDQHMHALVLALLQKKQYLNQSINGISEGIENYIDYNYQFGLSYEQNIDLLANKKYTKSRIRRVILSLMLEITKSIATFDLRILGFSSTGLSYLRQMNLNDVIINIDKTNKEKLAEELRSVSLYSLLLNKDYTIEEYQFPLKRKE